MVFEIGEINLLKVCGSLFKLPSQSFETAVVFTKGVSNIYNKYYGEILFLYIKVSTNKTTQSV